MSRAEPLSRPDSGRYTLRFTLVAAFTGITLLVSAVIGVATSSLVSDFVREEFRLRLGDLAAIAAAQIDVTAHSHLRDKQDQSSPVYRAMRDQLRDIRDRGTHIRFIYTTRLGPDGQVRFVVDAEENPDDFSTLGDVYADASPELRAAFAASPRAHKSLVTQRFYTDAWGTWMSAFAPLYLPDGRLEGMLGIDVSADHILAQQHQYQLVLWGASVLLTLSLMPLAYWIAQRIRRPLSRLEGDMMKVRQFNLESTPPIRSRVIEINRMVEQLESMRSGLRSFQKYVPAELVRRLIARGADAELGGSELELTMFMSDIEGFTSLSERMEPDRLVHHLSEYLTVVTESLLQTGATVDQYIGDAVFAFWNAPEPVADHACQACEAALRAQQAIGELNRRWQAAGLDLLFRTRIGINTGTAIVGNIGSNDRMSYTAIGDQVNLTSRLEGASKFYGTSVILSQHTHDRLLHDRFITRLLDQLVAYGTSVPIRVYELVGHRTEVSEATLTVIADYETAFAHHLRREFAAAADTLSRHPKDRPSCVLLERCRAYQEQPPPDGWDGSFMLASK